MRALGRMGDAGALPLLSDLFHPPGSVGSGVVYDALLAFGPGAEPVFAGGLHSQVESVRVASCFGVAALSEPESALGTRIAWSRLNGLLIISGAFGVFRRDLLRSTGGLSKDTP